MLEAWYNSLTQTIAPPFCWYCRSYMNTRRPLCTTCDQSIRPVFAHELRISNETTIPVFALSAYEDPLRTFILAKNHGHYSAAEQLGVLMAEKIPFSRLACDLLIPIPLHWRRYAYRGFNQAAVIAQVISSRIKKPVIDALARKKNTHFQSSLTAHERFNNIAESFQLTVDPSLLTKKHIILVDDLMTTGSTVAAAARVLYRGKPASVSVVVACRATALLHQ